MRQKVDERPKHEKTSPCARLSPHRVAAEFRKASSCRSLALCGLAPRQLPPFLLFLVRVVGGWSSPGRPRMRGCVYDDFVGRGGRISQGEKVNRLEPSSGGLTWWKRARIQLVPLLLH